VGSIIVTTNLPRDMCLPQGKGMLFHGNDCLMTRLFVVERVYVNSCASVKLLMAFSWICTINRESFTRLSYDIVPDIIRLQFSSTLFSLWAPL
jgi:hypothetical protein